MPKDTEKQRVFTRRAVILGGAQLAGFSLLAGRLAYLQLFKDEKYASLSENNRIKLQLVAPERGAILDRNGEILVNNSRNYQLYIDMSGFSRAQLNDIISWLELKIGLPAKTKKLLNSVKLRNAMRPQLLKENLSWEELSRIELHLSKLPGIFINLGQIRHYPLGEEAAHLTGYVGTVSEGDLSEDDQPLLRLPDFKIGKNGVEEMLEQRLRGIAGVKRLEVDVHGIPVREIDKRDSVTGESITLTIDKRLQSFTAQLLKNEAAAAIVMNVHNGDILTMASMPAFNPEIFSLGIRSDYWKALGDDKKVPLMNKAITGQYPPGSTFKMLVALAALENKIINPATKINCPGHFDLGNHRFNCWKEGGHGIVDCRQAIAMSCDTFFYTAAQRLGIEPIAEMARKFGLGAGFNLGMIGEKNGIVPDPDWKMKRYKQPWSGGDTINSAIGQGYSLATPLQLCVMMARMAAGGLEIMPRLENKTLENKGPENNIPLTEQSFASLKIAPENLQLIMAAMADVVNAPHGTAYSKRIMSPSASFGGKTGTSQVKAITIRGQDQNKLPWEHRHHALFVGYAPVEKPLYAAAVIVEHGGGGAAAAAPIARDILNKAQELKI